MHFDQIEPHTQAKHRILKGYLDAWFRILGKHHGELHYVDGFAGAGRFESGEDGSPLIALKVAQSAWAQNQLTAVRALSFTFVEQDRGRAEALQAEVRKLELPKPFDVRIIRGECRDSLSVLAAEIESRRQEVPPLFAFVDPFGFSGIPMTLMHRLLRLPRSEVFINFMVSFVNRFVDHPNPKVVAQAVDACGTEDVRRVPELGVDRREALLNLYRRQLEEGAEHVCRFDMKNRRDSTLFSLFFGSNGVKGFEKMKESMWRVDTATGGEFSDALALQPALFEPVFDDRKLISILESQFSSRIVTTDEVQRFVVEETDYLNKHKTQALRAMEKLGRVERIRSSGQPWPQGTYPAGQQLRFIAPLLPISG